jgi:hypothetical protein
MTLLQMANEASATSVWSATNDMPAAIDSTADKGFTMLQSTLTNDTCNQHATAGSSDAEQSVLMNTISTSGP